MANFYNEVSKLNVTMFMGLIILFY